MEGKYIPRVRAESSLFMSRISSVTHELCLSQGYVVRISGGNDKQGFPMKQGVLTAGRVKLLLSKGHSCFRPRRKGQRRRKSVHGCIVDGSLSVLNLVIIKKGEQVCTRNWFSCCFALAPLQPVNPFDAMGICLSKQKLIISG